MAKKYLITSALLYANGPLHFGHIAGAYLPADVYARFQRLRGNEVLYLSGSDEYGMPITLSADLAGRTPQEHVDIFDKINRDLFDKMDFSFDHFARTTWKGHDATVIEFFEDLNKNGYIEEKEEDHLFSEKENRFLADRYVVGICPKCGYDKARGDECTSCGASYEAVDLKNPKSKLSGAPLILKKSNHWYLRFDKFKKELKSWIEKKNWKENVVKFASGYIENLHPRAITRDSSWGIPVPLKKASGKVFYVWFDAPIGYISAAKEWAEKEGNPDRWKDFWLDPDTTLLNFIGKDNIPFHAVFFPAMVMGQNQPYKLVDEVPANEFLMLEGRQFSKSEGWTIDLDDFFKSYSSDQIRYTLAANAPETSDADFSWRDFQMRCNSELLGKFGNFVHRVLTFSKKIFGNEVPAPEEYSEADKQFEQDMRAILEGIRHSFNSFSLRRVTSHIMEFASLGNVYFDRKKPWVLAKEGEDAELRTTLYLCFQCIQRLALLSSPILSDAAQKIWETLGYSTKIAEQNWTEIVNTPLPPAQKFLDSEPLFRKIEDEEIEKEIAKLAPPKCALTDGDFPALKEMIGFETFQTLDLRVAKILTAEKVPKSKKLLKLIVDLGFEKRCVVSGIANHFEPEDLLGKKVIFVANLKPAKIMGIESQGMILAASLDASLELPSVNNLEPGSIVS